jgi:hypothetical protein
MPATYNKRPTFQMLDLNSGLDILAINHRGYWVNLGIDGTEFDTRPVTVLCLDAEKTSL